VFLIVGLRGGVANTLAEELEPLWLAALLLGVLEAFDKN
jgi:hypothetical protein